jgi:Ca2+/H+ antiporter, TMEM165/GDT1 family
MRHFHLGKAVGIVILVIIGVFVFGSIVMVLWNAVMPVIFHLPLINFWQALTLFCLAKILFGGFRGGPRAQWKRDKLKDAWKNMTPEQKEKFNSESGRRCRRPFETEAPFSAGPGEL